MNLSDFAFFHQGKIVKMLSSQDAHFLAAIDDIITPQQDHALLLLHGFASSPAVYREILPSITGYDRIVCPVLPGHAQSVAVFSQSTAQQWRDTARDTCAELVDKYAHVSIVGLSLGGSLALELSQTFRLNHLYLLAPALQLHYSALLAGYAAWGLRMLGCKTLFNHGGDVFTANAQELAYQRLPLSAIIEVLSFIESQTIIQPNCPTDLFLGRYDKVVDVQAVARHYAQQATVKTHWLEHSAHVLPLDGDKEVLLKAINK